ncbi:pyrimidine reductase family protein [Mycetocola zhujimingii]|uniref:pyrimidine reductase family protein n=1 Tax=Mycetocola zhujimingii TaxID=2079792 RepID=UPI000D338402|nr:pyrimidine reductase family protein [Mycetocola zhujimingii]AWB87044.1 pyrimidine reductase family protein [Mycetocola zhujimingii]
MTEPRIALLQGADGDLSDDEILALYAVRDRAASWLRVNFVSSVDGAATSAGLSAGLGSAADHRVFDLLRRLSDVVVVAAGTVRAEGYGPMRLPPDAAAWRVANGLSEHPVFAIVSASLRLDPSSRIFTDAPVRPVLVTVEDAPVERVEALSAVADVLVAGRLRVDTARMLALLAARGLRQVHCEGGPHLLGDLIGDDAVDELCLTISPVLEGAGASRIAAGVAGHVQRALELVHVLSADGNLLLRYVRRQPQDGAENVS